MSCCNPVIRLNPLTHKNMLVPCRKCIQCRISQRSPWELRLRNELQRYHYIGSFVTMTYSDDKYDVRKGLNYEHLDKYWHDLRKAGYDFKYYCVGEYGSQTARCHYHALLFGIDPSERYNLWKIWDKCYYPRFTATNITTGRIRYTLKYMDKETCSFSDWSNMFPKNCKVLYHDDSGYMSYQPSGVIRPRSWLSQGLGKKDLIGNLQSSYYDGFAHYGQSKYSLPHYYQDCISRNDIYYQYQRQFFDARNGKSVERSKFGTENDYLLSQVNNARNCERDAIIDARQHCTPVDSSYLYNSSDIDFSILNSDFDNQYYVGRKSILNPSAKKSVDTYYIQGLVDDCLPIDASWIKDVKQTFECENSIDIF